VAAAISNYWDYDTPRAMDLNSPDAWPNGTLTVGERKA